VTEPFVIAINGAQVPFSSLNDEIPFIVQAVLPFGPASMTIDADTLAIIDAGPAYRPEVVKKSKASVSTCVFLDEQYADISGIFFSNVIFKNFLSALGTDFIYLHNPKATNPLSAGWSKVGTEYWVEDNTLKNKSWNQEA
jgi:hypothetical protein